jgi:methylthioribose-1-phosphate isomerase
MARLKTIEWVNNCARIIDQTELPTSLVFKDISTVEEMFEAIKVLRVRGAPAIGVAAAFGLYLGVRDCADNTPDIVFDEALKKQADYLISSRPTAVNLPWAIRRMVEKDRTAALVTTGERKRALFAEALAIFEEDKTMCRAIGEFGFELIKNCRAVLTHCNAGGLATTEYGTALAPVYVAADRGLLVHVYADETRPLLQGARITAFELMAAGIPVTLICDNMAATVMARGFVNAVIVGADRIASNGDTANKIGTYGVALLAKAHGIPFYVAAPSSTFDLSLADGRSIPIEERPAREITCGFGKETAPADVKVFNPAFDVTPGNLITAIITDRGVIRPPFSSAIPKCIR